MANERLQMLSSDFNISLSWLKVKSLLLLLEVYERKLRFWPWLNPYITDLSNVNCVSK